MSRVIFDIQPPAPQIDTRRADVACFVGLARVLSGATLSAGIQDWLQPLGYTPAQMVTLTNVPIPMESYAAFTAVFDDGTSDEAFGTDYLATTVRSFFAQGGKKCYVVRVGDPITNADQASEKAAKWLAVLGAAAPNILGTLDDGPSAWTGVAALGALEEVSLLATPDLPALSASTPVGAVGQIPYVNLGPQEFTPCSPGPVIPQEQRTFQAPAPRLAAADYTTWATNIANVVNYLSNGVMRHQLHLREIQFVAAFPMPHDLDPATAAETTSSTEIAADIHSYINTVMPEQAPPGGFCLPSNISSAFLQLAYPWLKTTGSVVLLEQLEAPDGVLVGLLARNALTRGTFTSATRMVPAEVYDVSTVLPAQETRTPKAQLPWDILIATPRPLIERLSLVGPTPAGLRLLSDVTAWPGEGYRSGPVNRLTAVILRAARIMGERAVFQANDAALWGKVQRFMGNLLTRLWTLNALDGATASDAFTVRCDRTTMTQNDLDRGVLVAYVSFTPAATLETITVQLYLEPGGTSAGEIATNLGESPAMYGTASAGSTAGAY